MMREKDLKENGLADMAFKVESDHEVQMARAELYKVAKYAIKMHEMLKGVEEREGLEGWVQSKITKAADYLSSVYHHMDYEMKFDEVSESKKDDKFEPHTMYKDGKSKKANTDKEHKDLAKKGWSHDNPKTKKVEEGKKKNCGCGEDPCITYGKIKEEDKKPAEKMQISKADEKANTVAYQRWRAGDERYEYKDKTQPRKSHEESYVDTLAHRLKSKLDEAKDVCSECGKPSYTTLGLSEAELDEVAGPEKCWKGYKRAGTQKGTGKNAGKRVNKCVKA